jgi:hypothetical protein
MRASKSRQIVAKQVDRRAPVHEFIRRSFKAACEDSSERTVATRPFQPPENLRGDNVKHELEVTAKGGIVLPSHGIHTGMTNP